jgi:excisionase family DNA binding protein
VSLIEVFRDRLETVLKETDAVLKILEDACDVWREYARLCNELEPLHLQAKPNSPGITERQEKVNALYTRLMAADDPVRKLVSQVTELLRLVPLDPPGLMSIKHQIEREEFFALPRWKSLLPPEVCQATLSRANLWLLEMKHEVSKANGQPRRQEVVAPPNKATLTAKEAASILGYSRRYIYSLIQEGKLQTGTMTGKTHRAIRILRSSVEEMLKPRK